MIGPPDPPTAEEFELWVTPAAALSLLGDHLGAARQEAIVNRLEHEDMFAVARKVTLTRDHEEKRYEFLPIPADWWGKTADQGLLFWGLGDIKFHVDSGRAGDDRVMLASCVDVRFDLPGVSRLLPKPFPITPPPNLPVTPEVREILSSIAEARRQSDTLTSSPAHFDARPPTNPAADRSSMRPQNVPQDRLTAWVRQFCAEHPHAPFAAIRDAARSHFSPTPVAERPVKQAIADLNLTKRRGNPNIMR